MWSGHWMWGGFMWLFWLAVLVAVILLIRWLIQSKPGEQSQSENTLEILKKRYARGEIDKEEFEQKKRDLLS
ncbi:MAG: SHOCT domain-containing protein [Candidatus Aminicenantes bacterium]|nr:SHOCT domain-containing protein [Candidatus Aminicenantes bacterium]